MKYKGNKGIKGIRAWLSQRNRQRGVSLVETVIMLPVLMLIGLGIVQYALVYEAKSSLNYATLLSARAGALDHARPEALRVGFAKGLAPLYSPAEGEQGQLEAQRKVGQDILDEYVHFAIINPTTDAFGDFAEDLDLNGQVNDIPNLDLHSFPDTVGRGSGVNIQDANLLKVHITYGTRLLVPFVGPMTASIAQAFTDDPIRLRMLRAGRLPITASATVRMQNFATRNALMLSRNEVESLLRTALTPNPNPVDPPGNGSGGNGGGAGGNQPLPGEQLPGEGIGSGGGGDDPFCAVTNTCSQPPPNNISPIDPGPGQGNPMTCPAGVTGIGNPIHAVTGNKYQVETDMAALPGTLGLRFQRHYNSHDHQANVLGTGWRHSYSHRLVKQDNNRLRLVNYDGRVIDFISETVSGDAQLIKVSQPPVSAKPKQWRAVTSADGRLHYESATGYYHWQQHNGHEASFDQAGQLIGLRAPNGANVNLYYSRQGQLQQVVDSQRRKLSFDYYSNGRIKTLIDPAGQRIRYSYDDHGNLDYVQHLDKASTAQTNQSQKRQYHYEDPNDAHNLTGITDERGERYATWAYDNQDRAILSEHANGVERVSLDFSTPGQTLVTNSAGEQSVYHTSYQSGIPLVTAIAGPGCSTCGAADSQYIYNEGGQLTQSQSKDGLTTHYHYDAQGRLLNISVEDANGTQHQREQRSYQGNNLQPNQIHQPSVNPNGQHQRLLTYNNQQQLTKVEENGFSPTSEGDYLPITRTTKLSYDGQDLIAIDGPREDVDDILRLAYDRQHRLTTLTSPDGRALKITDYDAYGRATKIQTGEASPLTIQYNAQGQPTQVSQGLNSLSYEYSASGKLTGLTGPDGERVDIRYDAADRATSVIQANGPQLDLSYDNESRITQQSLSNANGDVLRTVSLLYDAEGRLRQQRSEQNNNETIRNYQYDQNDRLTALSNQHGDQLRISYNPVGQLLGIENGGQRNRLEYDNKGQAISLTDTNGNTTQQLKDDFGRIVTIISPDSGTTQYRYDQAGNRIQKTNAEGRTDHFAYDAANRLVQSQTADGNTDYQYHQSNGQLIQVTQQTEQGQSQERFTYDKEGRLTTHHRDLTLANNEIKTLTTEYEYNNRGKLSHKHLPDGQTLRYHYYQDGKHRGQLRAITKETFFGQDVIIGEIDPNHWDGDLGYVFGNGLLAQANYQNGRLQHQQDGQLKLVYEYDEAGNITQIDQNGTLNQYRYDQLGRLIYASANQQVYRYQYDKLGNRTTKTVSSEAAEISADVKKDSAENNAPGKEVGVSKETQNELQLNTYSEHEGNRLKHINQQAITYNQAGSPKTYPGSKGKGIRSYDYNANQRPIRLYIDKRLRAEYEYNAFGERIRKTVYPRKEKSNKKSSNSEDGDGEPPAPITTYYLYDGRQLSAEVNEQGKVTQQYIYYKTAPVALLKKKRLYHIHSDHLGTPKQITDSKGKIHWQAQYSPFGKAQINEDADNNGIAIKLNLRFAGQYEDQESGTYYNYFRDYDPETGRYVTSDPIGLKGGLNTYAYVGNNPLSSIDPLGLMETGAGSTQALGTENLANIPKPNIDPVFLSNFTQVFDAAVRSIENQNTDGRHSSLLDSLSQLQSNTPALLGVLAILSAIQDVPEVGAQALIAIASATVGIDAVGLTNGVLDVVRRVEEITEQQLAAGSCVASFAIDREGTRLVQVLTQFSGIVNSGGLFDIAAKLANSFPAIAGADGANITAVARAIEVLTDTPLSDELRRTTPSGVLSGFTEQEQRDIVGAVIDPVSAFEGAVLARATYEGETITNGLPYEVVTDYESLGLNINDFSNPQSGFSATLFLNTETGQYVLGFRGTEGFVNPDNISNIQQGLGISSEQYERAVRLARRVNTAVDGNLSFVGHSLGGGLASAAALATGQDAQTYNAAGLSEGEQARIADQFGRQTPNVTAYYIEGEILSVLQDNSPIPDAFGNRVVLTAPPVEGNAISVSGELHRIDRVVEALQ